MSASQPASSYAETIDTIETYINENNLHAAENLCLNSLVTFPQDFILLQHLALILYKNNQHEKALQYGFQAFEILKNDTNNNFQNQYINNLGVFFSAKKYFAIAIQCFERVSAQDPNDFDSIYNIGCICHETGNYKTALEYLIRAKEIKCTSDILIKIGIIHFHLKNLDKALEYFEEATKLDPNDWNSYFNIGIILLNKGMNKEAEKFFYKTIEIDPNNYSAYYSFVDSIKFKKSDDKHVKIIKQLNAFLTAPDLENQWVYKFHYALAKIYQDLQEYDQAFQHFLSANKHRASERPFNMDKHNNILHRNKEALTAKIVSRKSANANKTTMPIFIVGMPRSGTTLTEQILACHSKVYGAGETKYIYDIETSIRPRKIIGQLSPLTEYPEIVSHLPAEEIKSYGEMYVKLIKENRTGITKTIDKLPDNFNRIGFIFTILPNATIIHCRRHPLDIITSVFCQDFSEVDYANDLDILIEYYKSYDDIMKFWHKQFPGKIYDSYYEELVYKQEEKSRELIKISGLKWEDSCLDFYKLDRPAFTASNSQIKEPMYNSSIFRWKNYEEHLGKVKERLKDEIAEYEAEIIKRIPLLAQQL